MTVVQPRIEPSIQDWGRPKVLTIEKKKKLIRVDAHPLQCAYTHKNINWDLVSVI